MFSSRPPLCGRKQLLKKGQTSHLFLQTIIPGGRGGSECRPIEKSAVGEKVAAPETLMKAYPVLEEFAVPNSMSDLTIFERESTDAQPRDARTPLGKKKKNSEAQQRLPL